MSLNIRGPESPDLRPKIMVFGVGGAGGNAVNNMIEQALEGAEFVVANTDAQALTHSRATRKIQLGGGVTQGLGAGAKPQVGEQAAEESLEELVEHLQGSHMLFITAGMGGGTGTGAAPVIARAAREMGILTVGVVTKPFQFEGAHRMRLAEGGIEELQQMVDTLIVIPNQNLFRLANERTTFAEAFKMADDVLYQGVKGVTDLMVRPGLINLDFADVRSVMDEMGKAMMGTGEASGETRAIDAAEKAIANPLLDEVSLKGAKGVLINITGGYDLTLFELDEAANRIRSEVDPQANIIVGSTLDPELSDVMRVSVVATGIDVAAQANAPRHEGGERAPAAVAREAAQPEPTPEPAPRNEVEFRAQAPRAEAPAPHPAATAELDLELEQEDLLDFDEARFEAAPAAAQPEAPRDNPFVTLARESRTPSRADLRPVEAPAPRRTEERAEAAIRSVAEAKARQEGETAPQPAARQRFGLNNLIERMTQAARERESHSHGGQAAAATALRREPQAAPRREEDEDYGMDIPAFLRRQAN